MYRLLEIFLPAQRRADTRQEHPPAKRPWKGRPAGIACNRRHGVNRSPKHLGGQWPAQYSETPPFWVAFQRSAGNSPVSRNGSLGCGGKAELASECRSLYYRTCLWSGWREPPGMGRASSPQASDSLERGAVWTTLRAIKGQGAQASSEEGTGRTITILIIG